MRGKEVSAQDTGTERNTDTQEWYFPV